MRLSKIDPKRPPVPRNRWVRYGLGIAFVFGGLLAFLPVLGIWMLPVGLTMLSWDVPKLRRWRRRVAVWVLRWWRARKRRWGGEREGLAEPRS